MRFKKILAFFVAIALCFCFASCSNNVASVNNSTTTTISESTENIATTNNETTTKATTTQKGNKTTATGQNTTTSKEKATTISNEIATSTKAETTNSTVSKAQATTTKTTNTTSVKTTAKATTKSSGTTSKTTTKKATTTTASVCYITIECKTILENMADLKQGHSAYVPSDGYILKNYAVDYKNGDTAYDILKKGCDENNIKLTTTNSTYGVYVYGINNLDEKDCGAQSGWLYSVNNVMPPKSCSKYNVATGDKITFSYTCSY